MEAAESRDLRLAWKRIARNVGTLLLLIVALGVAWSLVREGGLSRTDVYAVVALTSFAVAAFFSTPEQFRGFGTRSAAPGIATRGKLLLFAAGLALASGAIWLLAVLG